MAFHENLFIHECRLILQILKIHAEKSYDWKSRWMRVKPTLKEQLKNFLFKSTKRRQKQEIFQVTNR